MPELIKLLPANIEEFSNKQIEELIDVLGMFPIKRRIYKRQITKTLGKECLKRELGEDVVKKIMILLGEDKKLKTEFIEQNNIT